MFKSGYWYKVFKYTAYEKACYSANGRGSFRFEDGYIVDKDMAQVNGGYLSDYYYSERQEHQIKSCHSLWIKGGDRGCDKVKEVKGLTYSCCVPHGQPKPDWPDIRFVITA